MADFEWFRSFIAIYRQGSISSAAVLRHMTQPALSQHLASLEAEIGEPLFHRAPRQLIPTERAHSLYAQIAPAIDRLEHVSTGFHTRMSSSVLRIGGPAEYIYERLLEKITALPYRISIRLGDPRSLLQDLKNHELDLVIATQHIASQGLVYKELLEERFILTASAEEEMLPAAEPTAKRRVADPATDPATSPFSSQAGPEQDPALIKRSLEQRNWIAYSYELPIIRRFWQEAFGERAMIQPKWIVPDLRAIKKLVLRGVGISVLPDYLIREELTRGELQELWRPSRYAANRLWIVYRSSEQENPMLIKAVCAIRDFEYAELDD